jgi:hypothetical protein
MASLPPAPARRHCMYVYMYICMHRCTIAYYNSSLRITINCPSSLFIITRLWASSWYYPFPFIKIRIFVREKKGKTQSHVQVAFCARSLAHSFIHSLILSGASCFPQKKVDCREALTCSFFVALQRANSLDSGQLAFLGTPGFFRGAG